MQADTLHLPTESRVTDFKFEKYAKLKPHSVVIQKRWSSQTNRPQDNKNSLLNLEKGAAGQYNGYMSPATKRKVKGIIENFLTAVQLNTSMTFPKSFPSTEVYPTFLTLTIPGKQYHCDHDIKEQFSRFMEYLCGSKEKGNSGWGVKNYIWVSETQKNGNLHFHVILDRALPAARIQQEWNRILERLGYVTRFRNRQEYIYQHGFYVRKDMLQYAIDAKRKFCRATSQKFDLKATRKAEETRQREAYERGKKTNWNNPPTTKIHAIQNIKKLTAYVSKYMTKEPEIVKPVLEENQKLVQENGCYYIETETVSPWESYDYRSGAAIPAEHVTVEREKITVTFTTRTMRGRIWGASNPLHTQDLNPYTVALESFSRVTVTTYEYRPVKISKPVYTTGLFGEPVFSHMEQTVTINKLAESKSDFDPPVIDHDAARWVEWLQAEHVPQAVIDKATARAGEHFAHYGGIVIPLEYPQKDLLRAFSPLLYERYADHYRQMFDTLYPPAGNE